MTWVVLAVFHCLSALSREAPEDLGTWKPMLHLRAWRGWYERPQGQKPVVFIFFDPWGLSWTAIRRTQGRLCCGFDSSSMTRHVMFLTVGLNLPEFTYSITAVVLSDVLEHLVGQKWHARCQRTLSRGKMTSLGCSSDWHSRM